MMGVICVPREKLAVHKSPKSCPPCPPMQQFPFWAVRSIFNSRNLSYFFEIITASANSYSDLYWVQIFTDLKIDKFCVVVFKSISDLFICSTLYYLLRSQQYSKKFRENFKLDTRFTKMNKDIFPTLSWVSYIC